MHLTNYDEPLKFRIIQKGYQRGRGVQNLLSIRRRGWSLSALSLAQRMQNYQISVREQAFSNPSHKLFKLEYYQKNAESILTHFCTVAYGNESYLTNAKYSSCVV